MPPPILPRFTLRERWAIILATALVIFGFELGILIDPQWTGGVGAVIVVIGVIFAASDLPKVLEERARNVARVSNALLAQSLINDLEEQQKRTFTAHERTELSRHIEARYGDDVEMRAAKPRKRFLWVEVGVLSVGTLMNGFGTWLATLIRNGV